LKAWLESQPPKVSVAIAARAALRVLPYVQPASLSKHFPEDIALPVFRANVISWVAAVFPAVETGLDAATAAADADAAAHSAYYNDPFHSAFSAAYAAAHAVRTAPAGDAGKIMAARSAAAASSAHVDAIFGRATDGSHLSELLAARAWTALSMDATRLEAGVTTFDIAGSPLWPHGQSDKFRSLWQDMKETLLAAGQEWQVWTTWYDDRLEGRVREEERELAYVRISNDLWSQGPAIVNAEIKRRIEERVPPLAAP
jgi:hypothetical protein